MNLRKILSILILCCCISSLSAKTYEELEEEYFQLMEIVTPSQKKLLKSSYDSIKSLPDKETKKMILEMALDSIPQETRNKISKKKETPKTNSTSVKTETKVAEKTPEKTAVVTVASSMEKLSNSKTKLAELENIISNHLFTGAGTPSDPIVISEPWEMIAIAECSKSRDDHFDSIQTTNGGKLMPHGLCYKLAKDLDFGGTGYVWKLHFDESKADASNIKFDGNGFAIKNIKATAPLFGRLSTNAIIKNLRVENGDFSLSSDYYNYASPFCEYLEGVLLNCSFTGKNSGSKNEVYDFAYSKDGNGIVVGCVASNTASSKGAAKGVALKGCVASSQKNPNVSALNDELSTWNALYSGNETYQAVYHLASENGKTKLVEGAPAKKTIPNTGKLPKDAIFNNAYSVTVGLVGKEVVFTDIGFPGKTTIADWTTGSRLSFVLNGGSVDQKGKKYPTYTMTLYTKQADGSYKKRVLDDKNPLVNEYFDLGKKKGIYVKWNYGASYTLLLTDAAIKSAGAISIDNGASKIYGLKIAKENWKQLPSKNVVKTLISDGQW